MITRQQALYLLEGAFDVGNPVMVHGTSVESTIELLKTGRLLSSFYPNYSEHPSHQGHLFFVPRKKSFQGHPLYDRIKVDLDGGKLEDKISDYEGNTQGKRFLIDVLGFWSPKYDLDDLLDGKIDLGDLEEEGVNTRVIEKYGLKNLYRDTEKRKGVCIGINEKIFELEIKDGVDNPGEEVMVHLPDGLDLEYVHYIFALGELEDEKLRKFVMEELPEHL